MTQAPARQSRPPAFKHSPRALAARMASFQRRIKAAGLVRDQDDSVPDDIEEFRLNLARRICMFIDDWHGCPERLCRRQRGCMAPNNFCANVEQPSPEEIARDWPKVQAKVVKALQAASARRRAQGG